MTLEWLVDRGWLTGLKPDAQGGAPRYSTRLIG